jgi:hypothetical protein
VRAVATWCLQLTLLAILLAGCSTCQVAVGGAVWAYDPEKDVPVGADLDLLWASDEDHSRLLMAHARSNQRHEGLSPVSSATATVRVLDRTANVAIKPDGTFLAIVPDVSVKSFREVVVEVAAPGYRPLRWSFPKTPTWNQGHYDVGVQLVLERDGRTAR